nr:sarcosine oxidase subunit gamma [Cochlodiniinecator piscidefendens]
MLPLSAGNVTLTEQHPDALTSVAPFAEKEVEVSASLTVTHGVAYPAVNHAVGKDGARAIWFGQGQAMVMGGKVSDDLVQLAAVTDQSDAWAVMRLQGASSADVLARLVPVDLRSSVFAEGDTVRTELQHMMASITCVGTDCFDIMVMRSFAKTAVHDLHAAMKSVAALSI